ncbi:MAG: hypothetical protein FJ225_04275 [Lentisphaerae bacterium]|nr:hypothetical protein [Lentisphaerota bacterium]
MESRHVTVTLSAGRRGRLTVSDDGRGMGLRIMRYRAEMTGGDLEIASNASGGTTVTCTFNNAASRP